MAIRIIRRHGKISRLPHAVRLEIHQRLSRRQPVAEILAWLNSLPAVHACLWRHFAGSPVNAENIEEWRRHGRNDLHRIQWLAPRPGKKRGRKSKIERFPEEIKTELNRRLLDGHTGTQVLPWVNSRPVVREMLRTHFKCVPVNHENLSHYRHQGFSEWLAEQANRSVAND